MIRFLFLQMNFKKCIHFTGMLSGQTLRDPGTQTGQGTEQGDTPDDVFHISKIYILASLNIIGFVKLTFNS